MEAFTLVTLHGFTTNPILLLWSSKSHMDFQCDLPALENLPKPTFPHGGIKGAYNNNFLWTEKNKTMILDQSCDFLCSLALPFPCGEAISAGCLLSAEFLQAGRQCVPCHGAAHPPAAGLSWYLHAVVSPAQGMSPSGLSPSSPQNIQNQRPGMLQCEGCHPGPGGPVASPCQGLHKHHCPLPRAEP